MKIYIDSDFKCHTSGGSGLREIETSFFEGKCAEFIEGYRYVPAGETWVRSDDTQFTGLMIAPWRDCHTLQEVQQSYEHLEYERLYNENLQYEQALTDIEAALGVTAE